MNKEIVLNCMPPFGIEIPSPAMSILKSYLCQYGYRVKVVYWNLLLYHLENEFIWDKRISFGGISNSTILYAAYVAVKTKDISLYNEIKAALQSILPIMLNEVNFYDDHIEEYVIKLDEFIDDYLDSLDLNNVLFFGFSMKMDQWTLAAVIAKKIKKRDSKIPIIVGGINTAEVAKSFLDNFAQFDISIYGEGESSLLRLSRFLSITKKKSKYNIDRSFHREKGIVVESSTHEHVFFDLSANDIYPNYDDFFYFTTQLKNVTPSTIPIEGGRGCHWNRCHFCYLNTGYKYRQKNIEKIVQEIRYMIAKYGVFRFEFLDNDIIGKDIDRFYALLDELIKIKKEYPDFTIIAVEIITPFITYKTIKKMAEAGIRNVQIGYESASNSLLNKIEKKNTFASNLNTIKHCLDVGITVSGINVIYNLLEEKEEDICEAITNIRFFRFIFKKNGWFMHTLMPLQVNSSSKYFKIISNKQEYIPHINLYQKSFLKSFDENTKWNLFEFSLKQKDDKWAYFTDVQYHYLKNKYEYEFIQEKGKFIYREKFNENLSEEIEFDNDDISIHIINFSYDKAISVTDISEKILQHYNINCNIELLKEKIDFLYSKGLVYRTSDYSEIVSIVKLNQPENEKIKFRKQKIK